MATHSATDDASIFQVSGSMDFFSWLICEHPELWKAIGRMETSIVADRIDPIRIVKPVYVAGLARSGSTILLEILASTPGVVSQRYMDFPPVFTPYAWNTLLKHMRTTAGAPTERAHKDGLHVSAESPEAMEEPIWTAFFAGLHDPRRSNVISPGCNDAGFADFYRAHIRKLLAVRGGTRYLAKANYQVTRLEYLLDLFPDARFVLPVRDPVAHITSLMKQHALFTRGQRANPRARAHLRRVGHLEFGLDRAPVNTGDNETMQLILDAWAKGDELTGWIHYWISIHRYLLERLAANDRLRTAARFIVFEDLCADPHARLAELFRHCALDIAPEQLAVAAGRISAPSYYKSGLSDAEQDAIVQATRETMDRIRATFNP